VTPNQMRPDMGLPDTVPAPVSSLGEVR